MTPNPAQIEQLVTEAKAALQLAYCPYSRFPVGAALLTDRGHIVTGCNVENASFGLTMCAERNAIARAVAEDAGAPIYLVVVGRTTEPLTPCGACRQVLSEFNRDLPVLCVAGNGLRAEFSLGDLLPHSFQGDALTDS
ncbi:MAG: cytidine deaminase [Sumerlaeia bacterium]